MYASRLGVTLAASLSDPLNKLGEGGWMALGLGMLLLMLLLYFCYIGIFLHLATRIVGSNRSFGTALRALVVIFVLHLLAMVAIGFLAPGSKNAFSLATWIAITAGIMLTYDMGVLRALVAAVLTWILTLAGTVLTVIVLFALLSMRLEPVNNQPGNSPPPSNTQPENAPSSSPPLS